MGGDISDPQTELAGHPPYRGVYPPGDSEADCEGAPATSPRSNPRSPLTQPGSSPIALGPSRSLQPHVSAPDLHSHVSTFELHAESDQSAPGASPVGAWSPGASPGTAAYLATSASPHVTQGLNDRDNVYVYQAPDGQLLYLLPLCHKVLRA